MDFYLSSFGLHNPYIVSKLPEHAIYPISTSAQDGVDLDYTSLLLGKKYYIDEQTFGFVCGGEKRFLEPMAKTLFFLKQEGFVETIDTKTIVNDNIESLTEKVDRLSNDYNNWLNVIRSQWADVKDEYFLFHSQYGSPENELLNTSHFAVINYLEAIGEVDNLKKQESITKLLESKKQRLSTPEKEYVKGVTKPLLAQILINDLVRSKIKCPILDWDDNEPYYNQLYLYRWEENHSKEIKLAHAANNLFNCVIPSLKPKNIEEVVKFLNNNRAIDSLRVELWSCIESCGKVTDAWYKEFVDRVFQHELNMKKNMKKFRWFGAIVSSFIPGSGVVQEAAMEATQNYIEDKAVKNKGKSLEWYYALQNEAFSREE